MNKRFLCLGISLCLLLGAFTGCSDKSNSSSDLSSGSEETPLINVTEEQREQIDLGGKEFTIITWSNDLFDHVDGASDYGDAVIERNANVEKELNCTLNFVVKDPDSMVQEAVASMLSGEKYADIILPILWKTSGLISGGVVQDLNNITTLDLSKPYWDKNGTEFGNIAGKQYFAVNPMTRSYFGGMTAILFNKRIVEELSLEDPYELYKNKQWTVSKMREMAKAATLEKDGVAGMSANDQWGLAAVDPVGLLGLSAIFANEGSFIIKNDKGTLQYAMGSPIIRNTMAYMRDWIKNDNSIYAGEAVEASREVWLQGNALFYSYTLGDIRKASEVMDDFGILPFPLGDQGNEVCEDNKQFIDWNRSVFCVPSTLVGKDLEDVGYLLDSLAYYSQNEEAANVTELQERYAQDDTAREIIEDLSNKAVMDYSQLVASSANPELFQATYQVYYDCMGDVGIDIAGKIEEVSNAGKTALANFMNSLNQ